MATRKRKAPWDRPKPRRSRSTTLSAADRKKARARARRAGRRYPNLVDNMAAAREKTSSKRRSEAGRRELARHEGRT
jgi:hypothetical protein